MACHTEPSIVARCTFWELSWEAAPCGRPRSLSDGALPNLESLEICAKECDSVVASTDVDSLTSWASEMDSEECCELMDDRSEGTSVPPGQWLAAPHELKTTLIFKNLPSDITRDRVCKLLDECFDGRYDFVYAPVNFKTLKSCCYSFVNFKDPAHAEMARRHFDGLSVDGENGAQQLSASWSEQQGLQEQIERFRNCPVMHPDVPDEYKPLLLRCREQVPLPEPTRQLSAPRGFRRAVAGGAVGGC
jgi:hypothetical protein